MGTELTEAYRRGDREALRRLAEERLPALGERVAEFQEAFYQSWMGENKPFGFEIIDIRLGGVMGRVRTARRRVTDYLDGRLDRLEELEQPRLFFDGQEDRKDINTFCNDWSQIATASVI